MSSILDITKKGYELDDIMLVPTYSGLPSRRSADISTFIGKNTKLKAPFIASPMSSVTNGRLAEKMAQLGGIAYVHRYQNVAKQLEHIYSGASPQVGAAISLNMDRVKALIENDVKKLMMDVASGWTEQAMDFMQNIKRDYPDVELIAGNVADPDALYDFSRIGIDGVRVGIGIGSVCTTRLVAGVGVPAATCLARMYQIKQAEDLGIKLLQDGGTRNTGDIVKCLALGADAVIIGRLFAQTEEAAGSEYPVVGEDGRLYKRYSGMASREALGERAEKDPDWGNNSIHLEMPEGKAELVPIVGSIEKVFRELVAGVQIGLSYTGSWNIEELREAEWMLLK